MRNGDPNELVYFKEEGSLVKQYVIWFEYIYLKVYTTHFAFYILLKKNTDFEWTTDCEEEFKSLKRTLSLLSVLTRPLPREVLYLYLVVLEEVRSTVLFREIDTNHNPIYLISNALTGAETWYQRIEKATLALVITSCKLRRYLLTHSLVV